MNESILVIGGGHMGSALIRGWTKNQKKKKDRFLLVEPDATTRSTHQKNGIKALATIDALKTLASDTYPSLVILAVKPNKILTVLSALARFYRPDSCIVSVAAGIGWQDMRQALQRDGFHLIRAMPNLAVEIGKGITALYQHDRQPDWQKTIDMLFQQIGMTKWLQDEQLFHSFTALCGSGSAYFYYILECLEKALPNDLAEQDDAKALILATMEGAVRLAQKKTCSFEELRRQVTSPHGTTAAAMSVLEKDGVLQQMIRAALRHAAQRSRHIAREHHTHPQSS